MSSPNPACGCLLPGAQSCTHVGIQNGTVADESSTHLPFSGVTLGIGGQELHSACTLQPSGDPDGAADDADFVAGALVLTYSRDEVFQTFGATDTEVDDGMVELRAEIVGTTTYVEAAEAVTGDNPATEEVETDFVITAAVAGAEGLVNNPVSWTSTLRLL